MESIGTTVLNTVVPLSGPPLIVLRKWDKMCPHDALFSFINLQRNVFHLTNYDSL